MLVFTASGGSASTITGTVPALLVLPDDHLNGSEVNVVDGTGEGQSSFCTDYGVFSNIATLTVPGTLSTPPDGTSVIEVHKLRGLGFGKAQYDDAINAAIRAAAKGYWTDHESLAFGYESNSGSARHAAARVDYTMPSGFKYLWDVQVLGRAAVARWPSGNKRTYRALGDASARTRLGQGFRAGQDCTVQYVAVLMRKVGSPADNLTLYLSANSSGLPGTLLTNGTSVAVLGSTLETQERYVIFALAAPASLVGDTQYHWEIRRSAAVSGTDYYELAEDNATGYPDGTLALYNGSSWSAVSGSSACFGVNPPAPWVSLQASLWRFRRGTNELSIGLELADATPIRLLGGAPIAELTSDDSTVPIDPGWVTEFVRQHLARLEVGAMSPDDTKSKASSALQGLQISPPPWRPLPANSIEVYAQ